MKYIRPCFDIKDYGWLKFHCEVVGLDPVISAVGTLLKITKSSQQNFRLYDWDLEYDLISFPLILGEVNFYSFQHEVKTKERGSFLERQGSVGSSSVCFAQNYLDELFF